MSAFLRFLLAFFTLRVEGDPEPTPDPAPAPEPEPDPAPELDFGGADPEPEPQGEPEDPKAALAAERAAREAAERREREANDRYERAQVEARSRHVPLPDHETKLREAEDKILGDPNADANQKYWAQANRTLRENQRVSAQALFTSTDVADRTSFEQLAVTKPAVHARYKDEVEKRLQAARSQGSNPSRQDILRWLIGQDAIDGKLGAKKKPAAPAPRPAARALPGARGDVRGGGAMSDREKRAKRLEGVQI